MRTTLTLDPDLAPLVTRLRKERGVSMARLVNELIRAALVAPATRKRKPFRMKHSFKSKILVGSLDNVAEVLELVDGPGHR